MSQATYFESEAHFRIYEEYVRKILVEWPNPTIFSASRRHSVATLESRLRIVVRAAAKNAWLEPALQSKLLSVVSSITFSTTYTPGSLWVGPRESHKTRALPESPKLTISPVGDLPESTLLKLLDFMSDGFCGPVSLHTSLPLLNLAKKYDVVVEMVGPESYTIL